jgi:hypothetical protein
MDQISRGIKIQFESTRDFLVEKSMLLNFKELVPYKSKDGYYLSWQSAVNLSYIYGTDSILEHYIQSVKRMDYLFCFQDGSLLQAEYRVENSEISYHRLCFFPCPFIFEKKELDYFGLSDFPFLFDATDFMDRIKLVTPMRFDFNVNVNDELHSASHFTFNRNSFRLPAYGPISFAHFMGFILRYYYGIEYNDYNTMLKRRNYFRTLDRSNQHEFYLDTFTPVD